MVVFYELNLLKIINLGEKFILNFDIYCFEEKIDHVQSGDVVMQMKTVLNITALNSILQIITIRKRTTKKTEEFNPCLLNFIYLFIVPVTSQHGFFLNLSQHRVALSFGSSMQTKLCPNVSPSRSDFTSPARCRVCSAADGFVA